MVIIKINKLIYNNQIIIIIKMIVIIIRFQKNKNKIKYIIINTIKNKKHMKKKKFLTLNRSNLN